MYLCCGLLQDGADTPQRICQAIDEDTVQKTPWESHAKTIHRKKSPQRSRCFISVCNDVSLTRFLRNTLFWNLDLDGGSMSRRWVRAAGCGARGESPGGDGAGTYRRLRKKRPLQRHTRLSPLPPNINPENIENGSVQACNINARFRKILFVLAFQI